MVPGPPENAASRSCLPSAAWKPAARSGKGPGAATPVGQLPGDLAVPGHATWQWPEVRSPLESRSGHEPNPVPSWCENHTPAPSPETVLLPSVLLSFRSSLSTPTYAEKSLALGSSSPLIGFTCSLKWPSWETTCSSQWQGTESVRGEAGARIQVSSSDKYFWGALPRTARQSSAGGRGGYEPPPP